MPNRLTLLYAILALAAGFSLVQCGSDQAKDDAEMILIKQGQFLMGGKEEEVADHPQKNYLHILAERPVHTVKISAFYMDKYEVTNAQYHRFLADLEGNKDVNVNHPDQPSNISHEQDPAVGAELLGENQPTVGLNWFDAYAYCKWAGKRLPTEAEWEYAARGPDTYRTYPWGNEAPSAEGIWRANYEPKEGKDADRFRYSAPVGSYLDGASPFGLLDMAGNADEWVQDWHAGREYYAASEGAQDPQGPGGGKKKVQKGGSYYAELWQIRIGARHYGSPGIKNPYQGVRCAKDLK